MWASYPLMEDRNKKIKKRLGGFTGGPVVL